jgi:hypothetical protein
MHGNAKHKKQKRAPRVGAVNPYMVARKTAMIEAGVRQRDVFNAVKEHDLSSSTVGFVIEGRFRNDDVMKAFATLVGKSQASMFPPDELAWLTKKKEAERDALRTVAG